MATGKVKWFCDNPQNISFGFITPDNGSKDLYFAFNGAAGPTPAEGQRVEYTPATNGEKKVPVATGVRVLS